MDNLPKSDEARYRRWADRRRQDVAAKESERERAEVVGRAISAAVVAAKADPFGPATRANGHGRW